MVLALSALPCLLLSFVVPACIEGSPRLSDQFTFNGPDGFGASVEVTGGILEACVNGSFLQMCNGSSTDIHLANTVCNSLGYDGQFVILSYSSPENGSILH